MKNELLEKFTFGLYAKPFDKKEFVLQTFNPRDLDNCLDDPLAVQLRNLNIRVAAEAAEANYYARIANRRAIIVALLSVIMIFISTCVVVWSSVQAHKDAESSTNALVKVLTAGLIYKR